MHRNLMMTLMTLIVAFIGFSSRAQAESGGYPNLAGIEYRGSKVTDGTKEVTLYVQRDADQYASAEEVAKAYGTNLSAIREKNLGRTLAGCKMPGGRISRPQIAVPPSATVDRVYALRSQNGLWTNCPTETSRQVLMLIAGETLIIYPGKTAMPIAERLKLGDEFLACKGDAECLQQVAKKGGAPVAKTPPPIAATPVTPPPPTPAATPDVPPNGPAIGPDNTWRERQTALERDLAIAQARKSDRAFWGMTLVCLALLIAFIALHVAEKKRHRRFETAQERRQHEAQEVSEADRQHALDKAVNIVRQTYETKLAELRQAHDADLDVLRETHTTNIAELHTVHSAEVAELKRSMDEDIFQRMGAEKTRLDAEIRVLESVNKELEETLQNREREIQASLREKSDREFERVAMDATFNDIYQRCFGSAIPAELQSSPAACIADILSRIEYAQHEMIQLTGEFGQLVEGEGPSTLREPFDISRLKELLVQLRSLGDSLLSTPGVQPDMSLLERVQRVSGELKRLTDFERESMRPPTVPPVVLSEGENGSEHTQPNRARFRTQPMKTLRPGLGLADLRSPEQVEAFDGLEKFVDYLSNRPICILEVPDELSVLSRLSMMTHNRLFQCLNSNGTVEQFPIVRLGEEQYRSSLRASVPTV